MSDPVIAWPLDADPAIRWQVLRDLVHASASSSPTARGRGSAEPLNTLRARRVLEWYSAAAGGA
jgi:hypothetical protein